jgi:hypothetical protein
MWQRLRDVNRVHMTENRILGGGARMTTLCDINKSEVHTERVMYSREAGCRAPPSHLPTRYATAAKTPAP